MRFCSVGAPSPPRVIQSLLVFIRFRGRPGLIGDRAAASRISRSVLQASLLLLLLGGSRLRLAALRLGYPGRQLPRRQRAISRFRQLHHHPAAANWRVFVRHSVKRKLQCLNWRVIVYLSALIVSNGIEHVTL